MVDFLSRRREAPPCAALSGNQYFVEKSVFSKKLISFYFFII
jgi:hypothetical protein